MNSNRSMKMKIIMFVIFIFTLVLSFNNNPNNKNSDTINLINENVKISSVSEKIHINGNSGWLAFKNAGNCSGQGTYSDPYVIEDLIINGSGSGSCLFIENSDVYFRIENCTFFNSGNGEIDSGIKLSYVYNGYIVNITSYNCRSGIFLSYSDNNTIIGNIFLNNFYGILIEYSDNNLFYLNNIGGFITIFFSYSTFTFNSLKKMLYTYQDQNYTNYLGNYWSDYDEPDRDNDGIGDWNKHVLAFETGYHLYDYYPLMEPTWNYEIHKIVESEEETNGEKISGYNLLFLIGISCTIVVFIFKRLKEQYKLNSK